MHKDSEKNSPRPKPKSLQFGMAVTDALNTMGLGQYEFAERIGINGPGFNRICNGHNNPATEGMRKIVEGLRDDLRPRALAAWLADSIDSLPPEIRSLVNITAADSGTPVLAESEILPPRPQLDHKKRDMLLWVETMITDPNFFDMLEIYRRIIRGR